MNEEMNNGTEMNRDEQMQPETVNGLDAELTCGAEMTDDAGIPGAVEPTPDTLPVYDAEPGLDALLSDCDAEPEPKALSFHGVKIEPCTLSHHDTELGFDLDTETDDDAEETPAEQGAEKRRGLTLIQKWLVVICVVLTLAIGGVLTVRSLFVEPELPSVNPNTPPFGVTEDPQNPTQPSEEPDYEDGVVPKTTGERKSDQYYTILIMGRDTGGGGNTDTMLLASYDVTNQKATVMSIPRDTMVNVSWDSKKINTVYNVSGGGQEGLKAVYKEVSQLVGFEPDFEVVVEWEAVGALVDAIGGVWFDVPYTMDYHDPYQDLVIEQEKGYRLLNGEDAMQVIRWRKNDPDSPHGYHGGIGDSGRMKMQQDFLKAVIKQLLQIGNATKIRELARVFEENVQTSLTFRNILWFGLQAVQGGLKVEDVTFATMPYTYADVYSRTYSQKLGYPWYLSYVIPKADALLELVNGSLSPFKERFTLEDLDIMYVNKDGTIGSTSGTVADKAATVPPPVAKTDDAASAGSGGAA